jgi:hypothetical protein
MDDERFDSWSRALGQSRSRRGALAALGGLGLAAAPGFAGARHGRKGKSRRRAQPASVHAASKPATNGLGQYQTLAAKWWAWAVGDDLAPVQDTTGAHCADDQQGNVWYLAGSDLGAGSIERTCTVPKRAKIFFPVINIFAFAPPAMAACPAVPVPTTRQLHEHQECVRDFTDTFIDTDSLAAFVDGEPMEIVRATSALFPLHLDDDNPYSAFGVTAGTYLESADGYWVLLDPLSPGEHTITFTADVNGDYPVPISHPAIDVTYHLTVA